MRHELLMLAAGLAVFLLVAISARADSYAGWTNNFTVGTRTSVNATEANYLIRVNVTWKTGMNANFSDLFPTTLDKATNLSFWIFNYSASDWAMMEVNVPASITTNFYNFTVWYGNATCTRSYGNFTSTYLFSDNFTRADSTTIGANWTERNSDWGITNNRLSSGYANASYYGLIQLDGITTVNVSARALFNMSWWDVADSSAGLSLRANTATDGGHYSYTIFLSNRTACRLQNVDVAVGSYAAISSYTDNQTIWMEIAVSGNSIYGKCWYENSAEPANWTVWNTFTTQTSGEVGLFGDTTYGKMHAFVKNLTVRRYWDWEPSVVITYPTASSLPQPAVVSPSSNNSVVSVKYQIVNATDFNTVSSGKVEWCNTTCVNYTATCAGKYCWLNMSQTVNLTYVVTRVYLTNASGENVSKDMYINFSNLQTPSVPDYCMGSNISTSGSGQDTLIKINGSSVTLDDIWNCLGNTTLQKQDANNWFLNANMTIVSPGTFWLNTSGYWLKINSTGQAILHNISYIGTPMYTSPGVKITTWNSETNGPDTGSYCDLDAMGCPCSGTGETLDRRSAVYVVNSPLRSYVNGSNISYLGYGCGWSPYFQKMGLYFINSTVNLTNNSIQWNRAVAFISSNNSLINNNLMLNQLGLTVSVMNADNPSTFQGWNNVIVNNTWTYSAGNGLYEPICFEVWQNRNTLIKGNNCTDASYAFLLEGPQSSNTTLEDNVYTGCTYGISPAWGGSNALFKNNTGYNNGNNVYMISNPTWGTLTNYTYLNNSFQNSTGVNVYLSTSYTSGWTFFNNRISGGASYNMQTVDAMNATWNDWGLYTNASIAAELSGTVTYYPFLGDTLSGGDTTPPDINWITPVNQSFTANVSQIDWDVTVSETPNVCLLAINSSANVSMAYSGGHCIYNSTSLTNQTTYCGKVYANDSSGNMNLSTIRCATVNLTQGISDTDPPDVFWSTPTPDNNSFTANSSTITWRIAISEVPNTCQLSVNGSANVSMSYVGGHCSYTYYSLTNQTTYCALAYADDPSGNLNVTDVRCATINLSQSEASPGPVITIISPENTTYASLPVWLNYTVAANGTLSAVWYSLNGGPNISLGSNFTDLCYQETANSATACSGVSGGSYGTDGSWGNCTASLSDGDWDTGCYTFDPGNFYSTYVRPAIIDATTTNISVACRNLVGDVGPVYRYNLTIPSACLNHSTGNLSTAWYSAVYNNNNISTLKCLLYNSSWAAVADLGNDTADCSDPVEEGVWWGNIGTEFTALTPVLGSNTVSVFANDTDGLLGSSSVGFTYDYTQLPASPNVTFSPDSVIIGDNMTVVPVGNNTITYWFRFGYPNGTNITAWQATGYMDIDASYENETIRAYVFGENNLGNGSVNASDIAVTHLNITSPPDGQLLYGSTLAFTFNITNQVSQNCTEVLGTATNQTAYPLGLIASGVQNHSRYVPYANNSYNVTCYSKQNASRVYYKAVNFTNIFANWSVSIYKENEWYTPLNITSANLSLFVNCQGGDQYVYNFTGTSISDILPPCEAQSITVKVDYASDSYARERSIPDCRQCDIRMYMADALVYTVLQIPVYMSDYNYFNSRIELFKLSAGNHYTIAQGYFDVEHKYVVYLLKDNTYFIRIDRGPSTEVREIGYLYAATATAQYISLSNIQLQPSIALISDNLQMSAAFDNESAPTSTLRIQYRDFINQTISVRVRIFSDINNTPWYDNTYYSTDNLSITLNGISTSLRGSVHFEVHHLVLGNSPIDFVVAVGRGLGIDFGLDPSMAWVYAAIGYVIMLFTMFIIVPEIRLVGYLILLAELGIFSYFSWFVVFNPASIALFIAFMIAGMLYELKFKGVQ
jgi:hypothetical protein